MGFTEVTFLFVFMPASVLVYLLADRILHDDKVNNSLLVLMSLGFYFWASRESLLIFILIGLFTYFTGRALRKKEDSPKNRIAIPVIILTGLLLFYKYSTIIISTINNFVNIGWLRLGEVIAPVGISFVVFEAISYILDSYRGDSEPGSLLDCFTFLSLFPKLVSGPIVLWKDFKGQLKDRRVQLDLVTGGIDRIIIGYSKKVIIADTFGAQLSLIQSGIASGGIDVPTMWLRAVLYFFQLYFDFSGYSDIAIGLCNFFGFKIKKNFNCPYVSVSITEFWRRWHISLGAWFREYVYIPLGGNRKGNVYLHLLIVFVLTGLWHGNGLQFLAWGLIHGLVIILERAVRDRGWYKKIPGFIKWFLTTVIVFIAWIFFMSKDLPAAGQAVAGLFTSVSEQASTFTWEYYLENRIIILLAVCCVLLACSFDKPRAFFKGLYEKPAGRIAGRMLLLGLLVVDLMFIFNSSYSPFMYFQF